MFEVTKHAKYRIKQRMGLSTTISEKIAKKALDIGIKSSDVSGGLRRYLDMLYLTRKTANNIRIYNDKIFIFSNEILITILNLPNRFKNIINSNKSQMEKLKSKKPIYKLKKNIYKEKINENYSNELDYLRLLENKELIMSQPIFTEKNVIEIFSGIKDEFKNEWNLTNLREAINRKEMQDEKVEKIHKFYFDLKNISEANINKLKREECNNLKSVLVEFYLHYDKEINKEIMYNYIDLEKQFYSSMGLIWFNKKDIGKLTGKSKEFVKAAIDTLVEVKKISIVNTKLATYIKLKRL